MTMIEIPLPTGTAVTARIQGVIDETGWLVLSDGCRIPPEHYGVWAGCAGATVSMLVPPAGRAVPLWDLGYGDE